MLDKVAKIMENPTTVKTVYHSDHRKASMVLMFLQATRHAKHPTLALSLSQASQKTDRMS